MISEKIKNNKRINKKKNPGEIEEKKITKINKKKPFKTFS